jgi:hypothetical protein
VPDLCVRDARAARSASDTRAPRDGTPRLPQAASHRAAQLQASARRAPGLPWALGRSRPGPRPRQGK